MNVLNSLRLQRANRQLRKVNAFAPKMAQLSDQALSQQTTKFKQRLAKGETLDQLLPEAYATVREAAKRVLGMYHYDVQVLGGIILHQGQIAEMRTGEGKTLTATLPLYLNALTGQGVMLITTNSYLARRDAEEMGPLYRFLGLSIAIGVADDEQKKLTYQEKQRIYQADIVYTTNGTLGFDYLLDNLADAQARRYLRPFHYAIIDEIDAVLLDSAQMPLIISGKGKVQSNLYQVADEFVQLLVLDQDYQVDQSQNAVWLTSEGVKAAERFFGVHSLYQVENRAIVKQILLALRAHHLFERDRDYALYQQEVVLLDAKSGRLLHGTKLNGGQHQAIEAKEQVKLTMDLKTMASVTFQNLFRLFPKLAGMSGTAKVEEAEFQEIYGLSVVVIPTHRPVIRQDLPDVIFSSLVAKIEAAFALVQQLHAKGQPILVVAGTVELSELFSQLLLRDGIAHNVLNAHNEAYEATIIKEAGRKGAVTVATPMAGRGTDIKLTEEVVQLGGLAVVGLERMENRRIDLQVRGRSGRQGDPGMSQFFVSLEDDLMVKWLPPQTLAKAQAQAETLNQAKYQRLVVEAQLTNESNARSNREQALQYDESVRVQRQLMYAARDLLLSQGQIPLVIEQVAREVVQHFMAQQPTLSYATLMRFLLDYVTLQPTQVEQLLAMTAEEQVEALVHLIVEEQTYKQTVCQSQAEFEEFQRIALLKAMDECWVDQIDYLQVLRPLVLGRQYAQKNPIYEYQIEASYAYDAMLFAIKQRFIKYLSTSRIQRNAKGQMEIYFS